MEIKLKKVEVLPEPIVISVDVLLKYKDVMKILTNFIYTSILKGIKSVYFSDESSDIINKAIVRSIEEFTTPNPSEHTIRCAINGTYIFTATLFENGTTTYSDDKVEFTIQKVSTE